MPTPMNVFSEYLLGISEAIDGPILADDFTL